MKHQLLDGIRVLDFTRVLTGPHCTKLLLDLGASVDKIEPPSGDLARLGLPMTGSVSHFFAQQNLGKRNICIDLNFTEGREIAMLLAERADIIVENFRPGTLGYFGLDYASVSKRNPRVVYASISGYGQEGPWKNRAGFAPTVQAEVGFTRASMDFYGLTEENAQHDVSAHGDMYPALHTAIGILAALHQRNVTGKGQHIDVAMAASLLYANERFTAQAHYVETNGEPIVIGAAESPIIKLWDGTMVTIAGSPIYSPIFQRYCAMMRRTDLLDDPRFATAHLRRQHQSDLHEYVRTWTLTFKELRDLEAQVRVSGLALGVVRTTQEFIASSWAEYRNAVVDVDDGVGGTVKIPGPAWLFSDATLDLPTVLARRGEHNALVLSELGLTADDIARLSAKKVLLADIPSPVTVETGNAEHSEVADSSKGPRAIVGPRPADDNISVVKPRRATASRS